MDGRGGCCIARYGGEYDMSQVDRIMLRFRPIAPKPVNGGGLASGGSTPENGDVYVKSGRGRGRGKRVRRCVKQACNNNNNNNISKRRRSSKGLGEEKTVVTLPLLPETPEPKGSERERKSSGDSATWLSFESFESNSSISSSTCRRSKVVGEEMSTMNNIQQRRPVRVVGSCVTVDCVTDTWVGGDGLGRTDVERRMNLERDTCPGFVSDGAGRVVWTNGAYRSMVGEQGERETMVWLVTKERAAKAVGVMSNYDTAAFSCRVRVQYSGCGGSSAGDWSSLTLPCDVWRMESGGFAWRLDVKAALCLGR
ncbi:unnamed protein product [Prunus armeniaca]|uniref:DUF7950 domain-containing protein n=1 Tax=Prunus armeniaca TaxID=36596 RepID=A0A6J5UXA6_PRUAR|nr:unnamed protein product [Prunus armeniaca]CAB4310955.1 unnamed protein product [Prunus armeniaca]